MEDIINNISLKNIELLIQDWKENTIEPIIRVNKIENITYIALQISKILYDNDLNLEKSLNEINIMQKELNNKINAKSQKDNINNRPTQKIEIINEFMFKEKGFRPNILDYQNPMNNLLNIVLEKKNGNSHHIINYLHFSWKFYWFEIISC